jgi:hypothetical protein
MASSGNSALDNLLNLVRELERERGSRIWCVLHCNYGHICYPTYRSILRDRSNIERGEKVELLLHSGGGHPDIAFTVMKFFRRRFKQINAIVPLHAKSSATLMCLGADKIFMGELADLGPIDIQIDDLYEHGDKSFSPLDEFKSMEFLRDMSIEWMDYYANLMNAQYGVSFKQGLQDSIPLVTGLMAPIFGQIDPIKMGGYRRAIAIGEEYAKRMLALTGNPKAKDIIQQVVWEYPSHDFMIDSEEAKELGLPVERLPESQDYRLSAAINEIGRDHYHGFAPTEENRPARTVRKNRPATPPGAGEDQRINGSNGKSTEEASGTQDN